MLPNAADTNRVKALLAVVIQLRKLLIVMVGCVVEVVFLGEFEISVVKLLRAHGGCLGVRRL